MKSVMVWLFKYLFLFLVVMVLAVVAIPGFFVFILGLPILFIFFVIPAMIFISYTSLHVLSKRTGLEILVIDNDEVFQKEVAKRFASSKKNIEFVCNPYRAIGTILSKKCYDLIMIRQKMPKLNDEDFLDRLDEAVKKHNLRFGNQPIQIPPVIFFKSPKIPALKFLHAHMMFVLGSIEIANPYEFAAAFDLN